jgi:hypothetical protein
MNIWDFIIIAIIAGGVVFAVLSIIYNRKKGCHGSCSSCPYGDSCTTKDQ